VVHLGTLIAQMTSPSGLQPTIADSPNSAAQTFPRASTQIPSNRPDMRRSHRASKGDSAKRRLLLGRPVDPL
jgi:hypothetical protein